MIYVTEAQELFFEILNSNRAEFSELLFNLYEDRENCSMEAVFDDEALVIGRERPAVICETKTGYTEVLKEIGNMLERFYKDNKAALSNIKEISYGFVDGDLYYIKKRRRRKIIQKTFTESDFESFNDVKLMAWLSVYTDEKKREESGINAFVLNELTDEERIKYRLFLTENFDYDKYNKN